MINAILEGLINFQATLSQVVLLIPNALMTNLTPDLTNFINDLSQNFILMFGRLEWAIGLLPDNFRVFLVAFLGLHFAILELIAAVKMITMIFKLFKNVSPL